MAKSLDFKKIAQHAADRTEEVCRQWLPNGKRNGQEWEIGDRHGSAGKSLKIHLNGSKAGMWADFSTDDKGGDLISLVAYVENCATLEAARKLASFLGIDTLAASKRRGSQTPPKRNQASRPAWRPLMPVPDNPPPIPKHRNGEPDAIYPYRNTEGALLGYVLRWDATTERDKKEFSWLIFCESDKGARAWRWQGFPEPRPLYGLEYLPQYPSAPALICEGEKAADAARKLLPEYVVVTWPGGSKAAAKADYSELRGRAVLLWPDADRPGKAAMETAAKALLKTGVTNLQRLNLKELETARGLGVLPEGYDAADLLADGWTAEKMASFAKQQAAWIEHKVPAAKTSTASPSHSPDSQFRVTDEGLFFVDASGEIRRIADKLEIPALARDKESTSWGPVLVFKDRDGLQRQEILSFRLFLGDGTEGPKQLADMGLVIEPGRYALDKLKAYVASAKPDKRARLVTVTGWHGGAYVFPDDAIGKTEEDYVYNGSRRALGIFTKKGELNEWQDNIAALADGNWRLMFTLSAAFTGVLLDLKGAASFAIHWTGNSSIGKSGSLAAAGSVWGSPEDVVHSWRSTDNSLEYVAAQHNDGLLILDELKEVDPKQAGPIAYMLSNAKGKNRAHHAGGLREAITWRIVMLSSGEIGLGDHMASIGQKLHAGQTVRFIELPGNAEMGLGMWNTTHHLPDGKAFTDHLKQAGKQYHGSAARAFIGKLIENREEGQRITEDVERAFFADHVPAEAGGQVKRVASSFALVAAAGELAAHWGICPWSKGDATDAASLMLEAWRAERPATENLEEAQILKHVRNVIESNWMGRFVDWGRATEEHADLSRMAAVHNSLGFRKKEDRWTAEKPFFRFYVTTGQFAEEFASKAGFKPRQVAKVLKQHGILKTDGKASTLRETLPNGDARSYCIIGSKLWQTTENIFSE